MSLVKDIPPFGLVAGFEVRVWYRRQPRVCPICSAPGHRPRQCPLKGLCKCCRRAVQVARDCRQAWGSLHLGVTWARHLGRSVVI